MIQLQLFICVTFHISHTLFSEFFFVEYFVKKKNLRESKTSRTTFRNHSTSNEVL